MTQHLVLFQVRTPAQKIEKIIETAQTHFERGERLIFFVDDEAALSFLDTLLWKFPPTGFLPHSIEEAPSQQWIVLTKKRSNLNEASYAFNLCISPLLLDSLFRVIYDFEDLTNTAKQKCSSLRFDAYKKRGLWIEAR